MTPDTWFNVDAYFTDAFATVDPGLAAVLAANTEAGLPAIDVSPNQGRFLHLLTKISGARRVLEFGTLGGYSTVCFARALPEDGEVITLELEPAHAAIARKNFTRCGVADRIHVIEGPALDSLAFVEREHPGAFDLVFIDADKINTLPYYQAALRLSHSGTVIVVDNVVRAGEVANGASVDESVRGIRRFVEFAANDNRADLSALQTVGLKGYDGFALARVR